MEHLISLPYLAYATDKSRDVIIQTISEINRDLLTWILNSSLNIMVISMVHGSPIHHECDYCRTHVLHYSGVGRLLYTMCM